ncbi:MAG: lactate racemase domain-containing protein [Lacrimispora sp.]
MEQTLFKDYSVIEGLLKDTVIPDMFRVRQTFSHDCIGDVAAETRKQLKSGQLEGLIRPGMTIAVTGSSRGIANMNVILRETVRFLKEAGAKPFIIPAMGSHGGATAAGQTGILTGYGITEEFCGCPIISSMETVQIGTVEDEGKILPVYIDRHAAEADGIVAVNRIKPHSAFRGPCESGITKMLCIGLGKQKGADCMHNDGFKYFKTIIPLFGNYVRTHTNVLFGVATIENAFDETNRITVMKNEEIPIQEPELLKYAFSLMPRILVDETDVLIVREIGKNFSGSGMDPNITGTWSTPYGSGGIIKQRTVVLDLSEESHGNGLGIGQADTTTLRFFNKMDFLATYPNALTATVFLPAKLAMVLKNDEMAIKGAIKTCNEIDNSNPKIVLIKNTLTMEEIYLSKAYLDEIKDIPGIVIDSSCQPLSFDGDGNLLLWND